MRQLPGPPLWAEWLLEHVLPPERRDDITGDLREEYVEAILPKHGRRHADWWYLRQSFGLALSPRKGGRGMNLLSVASVLVFACTCWLATMELLLRHPGYVPRAGVWAVIGALCLVAAALRRLRLRSNRERWFWIPAAGLVAFGLSIFQQNARGAHFEGYLMVISVLLMLEGLLMLTFLGWPEPPQRRTR